MVQQIKPYVHKKKLLKNDNNGTNEMYGLLIGLDNRPSFELLGYELGLRFNLILYQSMTYLTLCWTPEMKLVYAPDAKH